MAGTGVARRIYTRSIIEGFYLQAGVVCKAVIAKVFFDIAGFLKGISFQCLCGFGYVVVTIDIRKTYYLSISGCYFPDFVQLMLVICCEYKFHVS